MLDLFKKIQRRISYYGSSGSPLRYSRKLFIYAKKLPSFLRRRVSYMRIEGLQDVKPVLENLRLEGFANISTDLNSDLLQELGDELAKRCLRESSARSVKNRKFFRELLLPEDYQTSSIFVRFALQESILKVVTAFFGQVPRLFNLSGLLSVPTPGAKLEESQLWHRDYDDSKILKLFVYFNDVTKQGDGPFTFIPANQSKLIGRAFIPKRISDEEMLRRGGSNHARFVYGQKKTSFLIDTARCYHMGSRCEDQNRIAYVATFTTLAPLDQNLARFITNNELPALQRLVLAE